MLSCNSIEIDTKEIDTNIYIYNELVSIYIYACVCVCACVRACVRASVCMYVGACVRAFVWTQKWKNNLPVSMMKCGPRTV